MDGDQFIDSVRRRADLASTEDARTLAEATVRTLAEHVTAGQTEDLAGQLPEDVAEWLAKPAPGEAESFSLQEFLDRVADRADLRDADVLGVTRAVVAVFGAAVGDQELDQTRDQLPDEFDLLFEPGRSMTAEEFATAVRDRGGLRSTGEARQAIRATLWTLRERISRGEAEDLSTYLPAPFRSLLASDDDGPPVRYSLDGFVERVGRREGVTDDVARAHVEAVFAGLADVASSHELGHVRSQLPGEFDAVFPDVDAAA